MLIIKNLKGLFSGLGFQTKNGRNVTRDDASFIAGPVDVLIDQDSGKIIKVAEKIAHPDAITFDGSDLIATSGFVDSHTHFIFSGSRNSEYFMRWAGKTYQEISASGGGIHNTVLATTAANDEDLFNETAKKLRSCALLGTTTLEIKSGYSDTANGEIRLLKIISQLKKWAKTSGGPNIFSTFLALHALPQSKTETAFVDEMIKALSLISKEGLADFVDAFPEKGFFSLTETIRFTLEAQKLGIRSKIHADELSNLETTRAMARFGAVSVDHLQMISDSGIDQLKNSLTVATLLPATSFYLGLAYTNARKLLNAGVQVALASDYNPGTAPSYSMLQTNLLAATQLKMSAHEILCASTYNGAAALGAQNKIGLIKENYSADLCLWSTRSTSATEALEELILGQKSPSQVFIRGKHFYSSDTKN